MEISTSNCPTRLIRSKLSEVQKTLAIRFSRYIIQQFVYCTYLVCAGDYEAKQIYTFFCACNYWHIKFCLVAACWFWLEEIILDVLPIVKHPTIVLLKECQTLTTMSPGDVQGLQIKWLCKWKSAERSIPTQVRYSEVLFTKQLINK